MLIIYHLRQQQDKVGSSTADFKCPQLISMVNCDWLRHAIHKIGNTSANQMQQLIDISCGSLLPATKTSGTVRQALLDISSSFQLMVYTVHVHDWYHNGKLIGGSLSPNCQETFINQSKVHPLDFGCGHELPGFKKLTVGIEVFMPGLLNLPSLFSGCLTISQYSCIMLFFSA